MNPLFRPLRARGTRGRPFDCLAIEEPVEPALADRGQRDRASATVSIAIATGMPVEVATASDFVVGGHRGEHDRVVADAAGLDREHAVRVGERVARRAVHLWRTSQGVRVLHQVVRLPMRVRIGEPASSRRRLPR